MLLLIDIGTLIILAVFFLMQEDSRKLPCFVLYLVIVIGITMRSTWLSKNIGPPEPPPRNLLRRPSDRRNGEKKKDPRLRADTAADMPDRETAHIRDTPVMPSSSTAEARLRTAQA
jgi:hypothetical protein